MKKDVILVPRDTCPLDMLAEMGDQIKYAWIYLHSNAVDKLIHSDGVSSEEGEEEGTLVLRWEATEDFPETKILIDICGTHTDWKPIIGISASDISFTLIPTDPEDIFFFKMEE